MPVEGWGSPYPGMGDPSTGAPCKRADDQKEAAEPRDTGFTIMWLRVRKTLKTQAFWRCPISHQGVLCCNAAAQMRLAKACCGKRPEHNILCIKCVRVAVSRSNGAETGGSGVVGETVISNYSLEKELRY